VGRAGALTAMPEVVLEQILTAPEAVYLVNGRRFEAHSPGLAAAIALAHAEHGHPRCLCRTDGVDMYVARFATGFIVKRMPNTGSRHAPHCPSYAPPEDLSGLGEVPASAIDEDPATGTTTLKVDFAITKFGNRTTMSSGGSNSSVAAKGTRLSLRGLLHYLWDQADLTRWHPCFAGKRSWGTVRNHLLQGAQNKFLSGHPLRSRLCIPEPFSLERRAAIHARRMAQWSQSIATPGKSQHLNLLIAEVKEIAPARYGFKALLKHVPDQAFALNGDLYRRLCRAFESELLLWGAADDLHMVIIATFGLSAAGIATVFELSLMPVTAQWLPIEDSFERQLVDRLLADGRSLVKVLRHGLPRSRRVASVVLTDAGESPPALFIVASADDHGAVMETADPSPVSAPKWIWRPPEPMPPLPLRRQVRYTDASQLQRDAHENLESALGACRARTSRSRRERPARR
jgi:hypothetical protein